MRKQGNMGRGQAGWGNKMLVAVVFLALMPVATIAKAAGNIDVGAGGAVTNSGTANTVTITAPAGTSIEGGINNTMDGITNAGTIDGAVDISASGDVDIVGTLTVGDDTTLGTDANTVNTIGNAGTSTNTIAGATNTITGTTNINATGDGNTNIGTFGPSSINTISGRTNTLMSFGENHITAIGDNLIQTSGGNNAITAYDGSNSLTASSTVADQSNTIEAMGINGMNSINANATTGINNIEARYNNVGVATANSINAIGNSTVGTTVTATGGNSTMSLVNGTASLRSGTGATASGLTSTSTAQTLSTDAAALSIELNGVGDTASRQNVAGASYFNRIEGDTLINGNTYINGTLVYTSNTSATTTVTSGGSILQGASRATTGQMAISNAGETGASVDANGKITTGVVDQSTASLTLTNGIGNTHGLVVTEQQATLSGGTTSSSLTMNDNGATFSNAQTGAPVRVHGVDDGTDEFDAVNVRQLASGLAMSAGLAAIPQVDPGKKFSIGAGSGYYDGQGSLAVGMSARVQDDWVVKAGVSTVPGNSQFNQMANVGVGYSW